MPNHERRNQTIRAAWLYHERGLNQEAVAARLGVSRSTVSRMLSDALELGIVRVTVTEPPPETAELAERVVERFGLQSAAVEPTLDNEPPMSAAAQAMARRLEQIASSGAVTIATGWGRTLGTAAKLTRQIPTSGVAIVDAFGHTTASEIANSVEVSSTLGAKFGARVSHIPAPGFAPDAATAHSLYASEGIASTLDLARNADVVTISVGVTGEDSLLVAAGYIHDEEMRRVEQLGAVGEIFGRYFDADGNPIGTDALHPISLSLDDLRACRRVIASAGGSAKAPAIKAAISAGLVHELTIDDSLANALLAD